MSCDAAKNFLVTDTPSIVYAGISKQFVSYPNIATFKIFVLKNIFVLDKKSPLYGVMK